MAESLKHQQQSRLTLLADCEKLRTGGVTSIITEDDKDIFAVLQRLEFEAAALHTSAVNQVLLKLYQFNPYTI